MSDKVLEIALDNGVKHTRYWCLNNEVSQGGCNSRFFEGKEVNGKRIGPLKEAKIWGKENGYTHLEVVRITRGKNKSFIL